MKPRNDERGTKTVDFLLAGGSKAGTESIYKYFTVIHGGIRSRHKQVHYFSQGVFGKNYRGLEKEMRTITEYKREAVVGHGACPIGDFDCLTMHGPTAVDLVHAANPNAKIIFILRNPVDRAYSHYWMDVRECFENQKFSKAVRDDYKEYCDDKESYAPLIKLGFYYSQVKQFVERFGHSNVRVWIFEEFREKPVRTLKEICKFIGLPFVPIPEGAQLFENAAAVPRGPLQAWLLKSRGGSLRSVRNWYMKLPRNVRSYIKNMVLVKRINVPPMAPADREYLNGIYAADMLSLNELKLVDLTPWLLEVRRDERFPHEAEALQIANQERYSDDEAD